MKVKLVKKMQTSQKRKKIERRKSPKKRIILILKKMKKLVQVMKVRKNLLVNQDPRVEIKRKKREIGEIIFSFLFINSKTGKNLQKAFQDLKVRVTQKTKSKKKYLLKKRNPNKMLPKKKTWKKMLMS